MFCSTIIPTIGRETLSKAVNSVLCQEIGSDFEIIVVNDSAHPLPAMNWIQKPRIQVIHTNRRERSVARNIGAAIARGKYLHFLDDDDWILPGAFQNFWNLDHNVEVDWLYGGYQYADERGNLLNIYQPDETGNCFVRFMTGEWLPLQSSLIRATTFFSVGGFSSLPSLLGGNEDVDLSRLISYSSEIASMPMIVATIRISAEHSTTNYRNLQEQSRNSREKSLNLDRSYLRLRDSANIRKNSAYWHGRILWMYLSSIHWNLQHKNISLALSRAWSGFSHFARSLPFYGSNSFWRGATNPHVAQNGWFSSES